MRLLRLLCVVAVVLSLCLLPDTARADWSISKTPEGQDILTFCRSALNQDKQLQLAWGLRLYPTVDEQDRNLLSEEFFNAWDGLTASNIPPLIQRHEESMRNDPRNWEHAYVCALKRRLYQLQNATSARGPVPSAKPAAAEKLPPARPAKITAPWSPKAMSTDSKRPISAKHSAERADAIASCTASLQRFADEVNTTITETNLVIEGSWLGDHEDGIDMTVDQLKFKSSWLDSHATDADHDAGDIAAFRAGACVYRRRLAQLEGSPLLSGAVDGSLNPMTIGNPDSSWKPQGKDARIIASDGKSAMDCVKLVKLTDKDSMMGMGGRVLSNQCEGPVEIAWCYTDTECSKDHGAQWTVGVGRSWPVSVEREIRWAACRGANTVSFVKGSAGLRFYCSAPAKK